MRSSPLIAAGLALAVAGQALAASPGTSASGSTDPGMTSPSTTSTPAPAATPPPGPTFDQPATTTSPSTAPSAGSSGANSSATAGAGGQTAAPSLSVGEAVKDSSGASIGSITELKGSGDQQMAVIKMGEQSFQVQANRLAAANGAAEINMTKAQIAAMLKGK